MFRIRSPWAVAVLALATVGLGACSSSTSDNSSNKKTEGSGSPGSSTAGTSVTSSSGAGGSQAQSGAGGSQSGTAGSEGSQSGGASDFHSLSAEAFGTKFKLSNDAVAGWKQLPDGGTLIPYATYTSDDMFNRIDGDAKMFTDNGMRVAMVQELVGSGDQACRVYVMDFPSDAKAKTMFDTMVQSHEADVAIPNYSNSVAEGSTVIGGISTFAHIGALYLQLELVGFGSDTEAMGTTTQKLLDALKAKTSTSGPT